MPDAALRQFVGPAALRREPAAVAEVRARAERLALRCQHNRATARVLIERLERLGDLMDERNIEEIVRRPADFDQRDEAGLLDADILERTHGLLSEKNQRRPRPRAMMPRRTSVVPPCSVSLGAIVVANASCSSKVTRFVVSGSTKAASSRTRAGSFCSQMVPRSLTIEPSTTGSLPACSMPATDTDMRRNVCSCATRRPMPSAPP